MRWLICLRGFSTLHPAPAPLPTLPTQPTSEIDTGCTSQKGTEDVPCGSRPSDLDSNDSSNRSSNSGIACDDNNNNNNTKDKTKTNTNSEEKEAHAQQNQITISPIYDDERDDESSSSNSSTTVCCAKQPQQGTLITPEDYGYVGGGGVGSVVDLSTCGTEEDNETSLSEHESFWGQDLSVDAWGLDFADDAVCDGGSGGVGGGGGGDGGGADDLSPTTVHSPLERWTFGSTVFGDGGALLEGRGEEGAKAVWEGGAGGLCCPPVNGGGGGGGGCFADAGKEADGATKGGERDVRGVDSASAEELVVVPEGTVSVAFFREVRGGATSKATGRERTHPF